MLAWARMKRTGRTWLFGAFAALAGACASGPGEPAPGNASLPVPPAPASPPRVAVPPAFPAPSGELAPSEARFARGARPTGAVLADVEACETCHADVAAMWRTSAHAFASFDNPIYRVAVDRFRAAVGPVASRHCAGCHDGPPGEQRGRSLTAHAPHGALMGRG